MAVVSSFTLSHRTSRNIDKWGVPKPTVACDVLNSTLLSFYSILLFHAVNALFRDFSHYPFVFSSYTLASQALDRSRCWKRMLLAKSCIESSKHPLPVACEGRGVGEPLIKGYTKTRCYTGKRPNPCCHSWM